MTFGHRLVVNCATREKDLAWIRKQADGFDITIIERPELAMLAVQGPEARKITATVATESQANVINELKPFNGEFADDWFIARTGYTGEDGFEIVLPATEAAQLWADLIGQQVHPCGLGARDTLRLEAGMNLYGQDMDELLHPNQAGLTWTVSLKDPERHFIGRKALEHFADPKMFIGLKLLDRGVMRAHMVVRTDDGLGEVTSGTMSPTLGVSVGFARLPLGVAVGDHVEIDIRGKWVPAEVCKLPFVRQGAEVVHAK